MPTKIEQVCPRDPAGERRTNKRRAARKERRAAKVDPENAPTKRTYRGYSR